MTITINEHDYRHRWHVYDFMKNYYYSHLKRPTLDIVQAEFRMLDTKELFEGIIEFELMLEKGGMKFLHEDN